MKHMHGIERTHPLMTGGGEHFMNENEMREAAHDHYAQGLYYKDKTDGDRRENLEKAMACFKASLEIYAPSTFPENWAQVQHYLGVCYRMLPDGNRQTQLKMALHYFQASLEVYTRETFKHAWA